MTDDAALRAPASKARDRFFIALVVLFVLAVMAGYGYTYATGRSFSRIDFGMAKTAPRGVPAVARPLTDRLAVTDTVSGGLQAAVGDHARTQFLGYDHLVLGYSEAMTEANRLFYRVFRATDPVVPAGIDNANMFVDLDSGAFVTVSLASDEVIAQTAARVKAARTLEKRLPNTRFHYYGISSWTMTDPAVRLGYPDPVRDAWARFAEGVGADKVRLLDVPDWGAYFFATDHHWSPRGAYQGYRDMVEMLAADNPKIGGERLPFAEKTVPGVKFRGASTRRAAYLPLWEPFRVLTTPHPGVHAYIRGRSADRIMGAKEYFADPPKDLFAGHYGLYNGGDYALIHYVGKGKGGNLLILGDSFDNSMEHLVASHFEHTYAVDLRHWQSTYGEPFDLERFVKEQRVTDVLVAGRPVRVMSTLDAVLRGVPVE